MRDAAALGQVIAQLGPPRVMAHNTVGGAFGTFTQIEAETLQRNFEINTMALFHLAQLTTPAMIAAGEGALIVTGNIPVQRGWAAFAGFAPAKTAQRILAESFTCDLAHATWGRGASTPHIDQRYSDRRTVAA